MYIGYTKINLRLAGKKNTQRRTKLYYMEQLIHNCITSPHSCHPHLGTCRIVTLVFVAPRQRTVPPSYAASSRLHP
jgi:hypothetical protein